MRCRGCKEHVGQLQQKKHQTDTKGVYVIQEVIRGTQHAKMKSQTQEQLQALEEGMEAMGGKEHHAYSKTMNTRQKTSDEAQQTTDPWRLKSITEKTWNRREDTRRRHGRRGSSVKRSIVRERTEFEKTIKRKSRRTWKAGLSVENQSLRNAGRQNKAAHRRKQIDEQRDRGGQNCCGSANQGHYLTKNGRNGETST